MKQITVTGLDKAYGAFANSDTTEGKGRKICIGVSRSISAVKRIGKGRNVQGSDATIECVEIFNYNGRLYGPITEVISTVEDDIKDKVEKRKNLAMEKALCHGLTSDDIKDLIAENKTK